MNNKAFVYETENMKQVGNVRKWGIAKEKDFQLVYVVETTKTDRDIEEINFSNIYTVECECIDEAIQLINSYQQNGYFNINIRTEVRHNNETIIEDSSEPELEFSINNGLVDRYKNEANSLKKQLQNVNEEISMYESFVAHYKSEKLFEQYLEDEYNKESNKDKDGLYWYEYTLRGFSLGCQPNGHKAVNHNIGRFGIIAYDKPLTDKQIKEYELRPYNSVTA